MNEYSDEFPVGVLMVCIVFLIAGSINGCGEQLSTEPVVVLPDRLEIVSKYIHGDLNYSRVVIIRDNATGQEFIWGTGKTDNITPIGYDLEYIEKLNRKNSHE